MKISEIIKELEKHDGTHDACDTLLAFFYQKGMPPPPDSFTLSMITKEAPNPNFWGVRTAWIMKWAEKALKDQGYYAFVGPCAHGRDPWDRCDECGEGSAFEAMEKRITQLSKDNHNLTNSNIVLGRELAARKWIREAYTIGAAKHQEGCRYKQDGSCTCGLDDLLK